MGTPCDICAGFTDGGIAFEEVIVTCSKCRIAREHIYCMRDNLSHWNWDEWVCESCFKGDGMLSSKFSIKGDPLSADLAHYDGMHSASSSKSRNYSGWQAHSRRQKAVMSGKVKYISHEEVKQLYSADTKSTSPQKASVGFKTAAPKSPLSRVKASSGNMIRPRRGRPPKIQSISISEKGSPISISGSMTRPRRGRAPKMQSISKINQQASEILKHSQEERASGTHTKGHIIEEEPMDASVFYGGVESSSRKKVKEQNKVSCTPSPSRHSSLNMSSGGITSAAENNHSDGEERDLNKLSSLHLNRLYLPALHATWKGGFIIFDADTPAQFIGGFQAQPPCKVRRKAYEFSKKMPPVLRANLLPRSHLWADPFQDECPELEDVALYFFPDDNTVSSRESYASLFEVMDTKNSVMRIYFDGVDAVELLIFTSKQLRLDLPNTDTSPKAENFLWGIFCPNSNCQADMDDTGNTADMEVDMVGGKMVGTVDVVVSKDSSTPCTRSEPIMTAVQQLLTITKMDHSSYQAKIRALDSAIKQLLGVQSEELKEDTDTSASSAMKNTHGLQQVKLEKDEDETSVETDEKRLLYPPRFPQPSPQSGAGSSDGIVGARLQL